MKRHKTVDNDSEKERDEELVPEERDEELVTAEDKEAEREAPEKAAEQAQTADAGALQELNNKYLRLYAEFDNYKKRVNKDKEELARYGNESLLYALLPQSTIWNWRSSTLPVTQRPVWCKGSK